MHALMKISFTLLALVLLLPACSKSPSDPTIRQKIVGAWDIDSEPVTLTIGLDGRWSKTDSNKHTQDGGTWQVSGGDFIVMSTNFAQGHSEHFTIVRISDQSFSCRWNMDTNKLITAHKL